VQEILPIHKAQLLSYMNLLNVPLGLLINFHEMKLTDGVHRLILPGSNKWNRILNRSKRREQSRRISLCYLCFLRFSVLFPARAIPVRFGLEKSKVTL
jgi:hypothetical protein